MNEQYPRKDDQDTEKSYKDKNIKENYKILRETFFKSVLRYDIINSCIKYEVFADISKEALQKRRMCVNIESLVFVKELSISLTVPKSVHLCLVNKRQ